MSRTYDDDTTIADKCPSNQLEVVCACGHKTQPAWGLWPRQAPLRQIARHMVCSGCGKRGPTIQILAYGDSERPMKVVWRWPKA